jgi:hypothetical protein
LRDRAPLAKAEAIGGVRHCAGRDINQSADALINQIGRAWSWLPTNAAAAATASPKWRPRHVHKFFALPAFPRSKATVMSDCGMASSQFAVH